VIQQGQAFKLKARDGRPLWAYRYHPDGRRGSARPLLGKATSALGPLRLADLSAKEIYAWRQTIPEGHRFEATQALRQVLSRGVEWDWLGDNPAKRVPNPPRRSKEKRPFCRGNRKGAVSSGFVRLRGRDSNPNFLIQSQASYR
jgi:hypothetical protein